MEENKAAMAQQQQLMQQQMMMHHQMQRRQDAMARFPSNIDAHLRPQMPLLGHRPLNPNSFIPNQINPNPNPNPLPSTAASPATAVSSPQQLQHHKAALQLAYQDAWRVCHPDFKRPFASLEDACERLLPYHVVADYEAEEDDKILDSTASNGGPALSRSQQWDNNIAAKVAEFTATFEKQVLAFNIISHKRALGEFRTEEKLMMEQLLLQEEKQALMELRAAEMDSRQKSSETAHEANMRMAAMVRAESQAHAEMMARGPIRGRGGGMMDMVDQQSFQQQQGGGVVNGWGGSSSGVLHHKDEKEPSDDFLNDDETENGDGGVQSEWPEGGGGAELDLNAR